MIGFGLGLLFAFIFGLKLVYILLQMAWHKNEGINDVKNDKDWYMRPVFSLNHLFSESFLFLSALFFLGFVNLIWQRLDITFSEAWLYIFSGVIIGGFAYRIKSLISSFFGVFIFLSGYLWLLIDYADKANVKEVFGLTLVFVISILFYSIGRLHFQNKSWKRYGFFYSFFSIGVMLITLFISSFQEFIYSLQDMTQGVGIMTSTPVFIMTFLIVVASFATVIFSYIKKSISLFELIGAFFLMFIGIGFLFFPETKLFSGAIYDGFNRYKGTDLTLFGSLIAGFFNVLIFGFLLSLIGLGYKKHETWYINLGVFALFVLIIVKYFDWFFTFMEKSLFFLTAGVIVLAIGFFMEKGRRYMISSISETNN